MRLPIEWLKEFVAIKLSPEQLAERLTMAGLEIGAIEQTESGSILDIEITPNRPDWLSIIGIAREVAAITGQRLKLPEGKRVLKSAIRHSQFRCYRTLNTSFPRRWRPSLTRWAAAASDRG